MRAVIIGNGNIRDYEYIRSKIRTDDFIICADGGLRQAKMLGLKPDVAVGDFDSAKKDSSVKTYEYPTRKDYTDGELAVDYAIDNGFDEIILIAMTGSRIDHTIENILLLTKHENMRLIDDDNEIFIVSERLELNGIKGKTLSIVPISGNLEGVSSSGLEYPLNDETLFFAESRGISNVVTEDTCIITARHGIGIVIINNGS